MSTPTLWYLLRLEEGQQFQLDSQLAFTRGIIEAQSWRDPLARRFDYYHDDLQRRGLELNMVRALWPEVRLGMHRWTPAKESAGGEEALGPAAFRYEPLQGDPISRNADGSLNINHLLSPLVLVGAPSRPTAKALTFFRGNGVWRVKVVWGRNRRKR